MCLQSKQTRSDAPWVPPTSETEYHDGRFLETQAKRHQIAIRHKKRVIYLCVLFIILFICFFIYKFRRSKEKKAAETRRQSVVEEFNQIRQRRQSMMSTRGSSNGMSFDAQKSASRN